MKHLFAKALALIFAAFLPNIAFSMSITKTLTIQVHQLCNDDGSNCAGGSWPMDPTNNYLFKDTNAIWEQAGIGVGFSFADKVNSNFFNTIDYGSSAQTGRRMGDLFEWYGAEVGHTTVDLFLVSNILHDGQNGGILGLGFVGFGGMALNAPEILGLADGYSISSVLAHELGHNLGLDHISDESNLMNPYITQGPHWLQSAQIEVARSSSLLADVSAVPEPSIVVLMFIGLLIAWGASRRRTTGYSNAAIALN